jgi:hypothetical protein rflaF_10534
MKNTASKVTAIVMLIFVSFFLVFTIIGSIKDSLSDKGKKRFPEISLKSLADGSFSEELCSFVTANFPARNRWVAANSAFQAQFNESIVNGVYVDGKMLLDADISSRPSSEKSAQEIKEFFSLYSGAMYFVAVPTSSGVYEDHLPKHLLSNPESRQISSFYNSLGADIRQIDAYNILKMLKENYIYYRSDTKWTSYGAYCVYRTVIQKLGFIPIAYDKYTIEHVTNEFRGNLYSRTLYSKVKPDIIDSYKYPSGEEIVECAGYDNDGNAQNMLLCDKSKLDSGNMYDFYAGGDQPLIKIRTSVNNERKILVIKDSFGDCFIPFLVQHYSEIAVVSPENLECRLSELVDIDEYEQTLFIFGIDSISDSSHFEKLNDNN